MPFGDTLNYQQVITEAFKLHPAVLRLLIQTSKQKTAEMAEQNATQDMHVIIIGAGEYSSDV
jgi:hypothetical protein